MCKHQAGSKAGGEGDGQVRLWRKRPRRLAVQERRTSHRCLKGVFFTLFVKFVIIKLPRSRVQWWIISVKIIFIICNLWSISVEMRAIINDRFPLKWLSSFVLNDNHHQDEEQWWTARNSLGQTGSIPVPYVAKVRRQLPLLFDNDIIMTKSRVYRC